MTTFAQFVQDDTAEALIGETNNGLNPVFPLFMKRIYGDAQYRMLHQRAWSVDCDRLHAEQVLELSRAYFSCTSDVAFGRIGDTLAYLSLGDGQLTAGIAGSSDIAIGCAVAQLQRHYPHASLNGDEKRIPLCIWTQTPQGPRKIRRIIDVPSWPDIEGNYTASVRQSLAHLMAQRPEAGKIMLWSGRPGTGKSFSLRALGYEWRRFCELHYIVDPETLFGSDSWYLMDLLLDNTDDVKSITTGDAEEKGEKWRLLVLEDTGEMLTKDAKQNVGQALARLLNVTDGLLGQGLHLMILVTTNEEIGQLHEAVVRPGRCSSRVDFKALSGPEADSWLGAHGMPPQGRGATVAELFGLLGGYATPQPPRRILATTGERARQRMKTREFAKRSTK